MPSESQIRSALRGVIDPELGVNIVDLGLVYDVVIDGARVRLTMTMTSRACPLLEFLKAQVTSALTSRFPDVEEVDVVTVWEPPWHPDMMSAAARAQLNDER
jgi:metal-sulfur cluster biosynthetic enzyme